MTKTNTHHTQEFFVGALQRNSIVRYDTTVSPKNAKNKHNHKDKSSYRGHSIFREKMASNSQKEIFRAFDFCRADPLRYHDRFSCFKSEKGAFTVSSFMLRICT